MKIAFLYILLFVTSYQSWGQNNSYTPREGVIESSLFSAAKDGKESPFFITANLTKDSVAFIELVCTNQMPLEEQMQQLKAGLFKSALQAIDSGKLRYISIPHLAHTADLATEINATYFNRFEKNPEDSLKQRLEVFLYKSTLYKNLKALLKEYHLETGNLSVSNASISSPVNKTNQNKQSNQLNKVDVEIHIFVKPQNETL